MSLHCNFSVICGIPAKIKHLFIIIVYYYQGCNFLGRGEVPDEQAKEKYARRAAKLFRQVTDQRLDPTLTLSEDFTQLTEFLSENGNVALVHITNGLQASISLTTQPEDVRDPEHISKLRALRTTCAAGTLSQVETLKVVKDYIVENAQALIQNDKVMGKIDKKHTGSNAAMGHTVVPAQLERPPSIPQVLEEVSQLEAQIRIHFQAAREAAGERKLYIMIGESHYLVAPLLVKHIALKIAAEEMPSATVMVEMPKGVYEELMQERNCVRPERALYYQSEHPYVFGRATDHLNMVGFVDHLAQSGLKVVTPDYSDAELHKKEEELRQKPSFPNEEAEGDAWILAQTSRWREERMELSITNVDAALFIGADHTGPLMDRLDADQFHAVGFASTKLFGNAALSLDPSPDPPHPSGFERFDIRTPDHWNALTPKEVVQVVTHLRRPRQQEMAREQEVPEPGCLPQPVRDAAASAIASLRNCLRGDARQEADLERAPVLPVRSAARR
jgi:hypothetical protein